MIEATSSEGAQIQYIAYKDLQQPNLESISLKAILEGFQSKQWRVNFDTITRLREANKFSSAKLLNELLPQTVGHIISQIDNLRSNNSKQALRLSVEIIQYQELQKLDKSVICPLVSALFCKTTCQKSFLKKDAFEAVQKLTLKYNPYLLQEIGNQILSINGQISELGAKILCDYMTKNQITSVNGEFLSLLVKIINGKRAVLQKKGKEILQGLKNRVGAQKLFEVIEIARKQQKITEEQLKFLIQNTKEVQSQKTQQSLKDYIKNKKKVQN